jgi:tRNA (guanine-N7-)-methyltransferase
MKNLINQHIKSFVRREGRLTSGQQRALHTEWENKVLTCENDIIDWRVAFQREAPLVLEIGFGMGKSLCQMAKSSPEVNFIGIEIYKPGIGALLTCLKTQDIHNVRILCDDAAVVIPSCFAENSLDAVHIFFPDPWPKRRHHKRRLIQTPFIELLISKLKPGGRIHLATDWEDYAFQMLKTCSAIEGLVNSAGHLHFATDRGDRPLTKYEERGKQLGHPVWDLIFIATSLPPTQ